jgi:hypothetical protein
MTVPASQAGGMMPKNSRATPADLQGSLGLDDPVDVVGVTLPEVVEDALADNVEFGPELVDVRWKVGAREKFRLLGLRLMLLRPPGGFGGEDWC